jgi:hypothetical protein
MFARVGLDHGPLDQLGKLLYADVAETHAQKAPFHLKRFEIGAQYPRQTLITEVASDSAGTQNADGTGERHAKACNDTANHSSQRAARRMRHNGLRLQPQ